MLGLLLVSRKRKKTLEEKIKRIQQGDLTLQNELIETYKPFVAKTVSSVCKRYIYESDDEFSIGLIAFHEAIERYSSDKGSSLISFAEVIIKRRVIDYIRSQAKHNELSLGLGSQHEKDSEITSIDAELSIKEYNIQIDEQLRKEEILLFTRMLQQFNLTFQDLLEQSPKHADARKSAILVAKVVADNEELSNHLLNKKQLPIKQLESLVSVSRKTIERNRKYIIAISLILIGDFVYLKDYIKGVVET
ncbi:RNA polymerase sigma factor SigI [Niallia endozanthoxylica]|uniref:RNA polymerase sigma factor SigI n=1 Tax=Niallia endozanthoxylica TaxID=2036016 RepID=A0A5J5I1K1_9BACI|nr:RNA polymerase sigma factor SigI [Niallia endozanthoxylica]KAA9027606.1 RNA polymerase sigma factor SigI [Niallia endozanthoxylica]